MFVDNCPKNCGKTEYYIYLRRLFKITIFESVYKPRGLIVDLFNLPRQLPITEGPVRTAASCFF